MSTRSTTETPVTEIHWRLERVMRDLSNPRHWEVLACLAQHRRRTVKEIAVELPWTLSTVSRSLKLLKDYGFVRDRFVRPHHYFWLDTSRVQVTARESLVLKIAIGEVAQLMVEVPSQQIRSCP